VLVVIEDLFALRFGELLAATVFQNNQMCLSLSSTMTLQDRNGRLDRVGEMLKRQIYCP
jgi:hypothetical protein